jgi:methyl-accepting chemotaxis protein
MKFISPDISQWPLLGRVFNLRVRSKLLVTLGALLVPVLLLVCLLGMRSFEEIRFVREELAGMAFEQPMADAVRALARHRQSAMLTADDRTFAGLPAPDAVARDCDDAMAAVEQAVAAHGRDWGIEQDWKKVRADWEAIKSGWRQLDADTIDRRHEELIQLMTRLQNRIGGATNLTLDPEAGSYAFMDVGIIKMPALLLDIVDVAGDAAGAAQRGQITQTERLEIQGHHAIIETRANDLQYSLQDGVSAVPGSEQEIGPRVAAFQAALGRFQEMLAGDIVGAEKPRIDAQKAYERGEQLVAASLALQEAAEAQLEVQLDARVARNRRAMILEILLVAVCVGLAVLLALGVSGTLSRELHSAVTVLDRLGEGQFENQIEVTHADEVGELLQGLKRMQSQLGERVAQDRRALEDNRRMLIENTRIRCALDNVSTNVVLADRDFRIIYANKAALDLFKGAEADFRKDLPNFDGSKIIGANADIFHKRPEHQRRLMENLDQAHVGQFVLGGRSMKVIANPVYDSEGARIGSVAEWSDRTAEVSIEREVSGIVEAVVRGELDRRISLQGKQGFFEALSKGINHLVDTVQEVVDEVQTLVTAVNEGDLTRRMPVEGRAVLFQTIGGGINQLSDNVAELVARAKTAAGEVNRGAEEISAGNSNLSQRTEEQASSLEETAASMEEMTSSVKQAAENAARASELAMKAREQAETGGAVVSRAVSAMGEINASSKKISDIIGVIDAIAFQTNLLALNAAVEAARAGEQGRGFAVVATEVRSLAGRSATAAKEIKDLINESVHRVEEGSALVSQSGETLEGIVTAVKRVSDIVADIAAGSREQSSGIEQVNKAVMQMDGMTQQNAALVEQAAAASQSMAEQALHLSRMMERYRLDDRQTSSIAAAPTVKGERRAAAPIRKAPIARSAKPLQAVAKPKVANADWNEF